MTKKIAISVTRRAALTTFGVDLAGMALACFGLANKAEADPVKTCSTNADCASNQICYGGYCTTTCASTADCRG